jgi:hypothetical protein
MAFPSQFLNIFVEACFNEVFEKVSIAFFVARWAQDKACDLKTLFEVDSSP